MLSSLSSNQAKIILVRWGLARVGVGCNTDRFPFVKDASLSMLEGATQSNQLIGTVYWNLDSGPTVILSPSLVCDTWRVMARLIFTSIYGKVCHS